MNHSVDTLIYDIEKIAAYQSDKRFDYNSQLAMPELNLIERFFRWLSQFFPGFGDLGETSYGFIVWVLAACFVAIVLLVIFFIYKKRPELFLRDKKTPLPYEIEEEDIYKIDFEKDLSEALAIGDFRASIRILYLQTLRFIADQEWIDWQIYKTPTEYTYELRPVELKAPFRDFTNRFLQVRYGNFKATRELYDTMCSIRDELKKGTGDE